MAENPDRSESKPLTNGKGDGIVQNGQPSATAVPNAKDPLRPRRKKAKRACFACQRAHLTCGMPYLNCLRLTLCPPSHCFLLLQFVTRVPRPSPLSILSLLLLFFLMSEMEDRPGRQKSVWAGCYLFLHQPRKKEKER